MEFDKLVVGFLVDEVVGGFFISVPPGHIACVYDRGRGVLKKVWGPGLHLKIPFWQIAKLFNAQIIEYTIAEHFDAANKEALGDVAIKTTTKDGHHIQIEASILFRIDKSNAPELWENIGENFVSKVVRPISRSRVSAVFASLSLDQIKNARTQIEELLKVELNKHFQEKGLACEGVLLSEVKLLRESDQHDVIYERDPNAPQAN
ncbi:MAG: prohibitin family protein [Candidatus Chisholmbacteria bacterium]|nr:prohibitin family protein [Candidatus Chisholmbacteria bacterium]